jgi:hypothetical protein
MVAFAGRQDDFDWAVDPLTVALMFSQHGGSSPALQRLNRLCADRTPGA